jgi:hypothetical protein
LFVKYCEEKPKEEAKKMADKTLTIFDWFANEMAENLEVYEILNFYYGIVKNIDDFNYEALMKILNSGFSEQLLPVHPQVNVIDNHC